MVKVFIKFIEERGEICKCRNCWGFVPDRGLNVVPLLEQGLYLTDNTIVNETLYRATAIAEDNLFKTYEMLEEAQSLYFLARASLSELLEYDRIDLKSNIYFIKRIPAALFRDVMDFKFNYTPQTLQACSLIIPRLVSQHLEGFRIQKTTIL